jgi:hypothetical protein
MDLCCFPSIGLKGQSNRRLITLEEVKQHKTGDCIWTVLKGRVYNIAPYMKFHPGGNYKFQLTRLFWLSVGTNAAPLHPFQLGKMPYHDIFAQLT